MDVTPLIKAGSHVIQSYAGGRFKVSGVVYEGAVLVSPEACILLNAPERFSELTVEHFDQIVAARAEVVLLGAGKMFQLLPPKLRAELKARGLSVDVMDTGAACRTYNVLMAEGRQVVAALFIH